MLLPINSSTKESSIEQYLVRQIRYLGGTAYKFTSPGHWAVPDRMCVLSNGVVVFVECKSPTGKATPRQLHEIEKLNNLGHLALVVRTREEIDQLIFTIKELLC